jgi:hypothetical protein
VRWRGHGRRACPGFARQVGDLVGTDHDGLRKAARDRIRLIERQPLGQRARRFVRQRGFVHLRRLDVEGQAQARQQFAPVAGGRGKDHLALHGPDCA